MSTSPEHQAAMSAASPDHEVPDKVASPVVGDDDADAKPAEPAAEFEDNAEDAAEQGGDDEDDDEKLSDDESILSEVDEAQFDNFDPENVDVEERPQLAIDEDNLKLIGRHKRKRTEGDESRPRRKEGRREKKSRRAAEDDGEEGGSSRRRERKKREDQPDTDEETLDPETRTFAEY
jgi:transcription factor SPN1